VGQSQRQLGKVVEWQSTDSDSRNSGGNSHLTG